jgi:hypothetical protein
VKSDKFAAALNKSVKSVKSVGELSGREASKKKRKGSASAKVGCAAFF